MMRISVPRNPVPPKPAAMDFSSVNDMIKKDLEQTGASADEMSRVVEESTLGGGLMDINDWIDQTLPLKITSKHKRTVRTSSTNWCWCYKVQQVDEEGGCTSTNKPADGLVTRMSAEAIG